MTVLAPQTPTKAPPKRGRRGVRWGRWGAMLGGAVLLSEVLLRTVFGFAHPVLYTADPACGYLPKPSQNVQRFFSLNYVNSQGMRSPEIQTPKPAHTFRVFCIGDSVTYGTTFVPQDQIFTSRLAQALPGVLHEPVEVLNASAGGWAPGNEFAFLNSRGTFDADLVVFIWNTGDLDQPFSDFNADQNFPTANPPTAIGEAWSRYVAPRLFHSHTPVDPGSVASSSPQSAGQIATNLDLLVKAQALAAKAGASFGLVYVDSPGSDFQTPPYQAAHQQLTQWTHDHTIPLLDLTAAFHDKGAGGMALTKDGIHLNPAGHALVSEEVASHMNLFTGNTAAASR